MDPNIVAIQVQLYCLQMEKYECLEKTVVDTILYSSILKLDGAGHVYHSDNQDICEAGDINH